MMQFGGLFAFDFMGPLGMIHLTPKLTKQFFLNQQIVKVVF